MTLYLDFETSPIVGWGWRMYTTGAAFFHIEKDVEIISVAWAEDDGPISCIGVDDFPGYKPGIMNLHDKQLVEFFIPKFEKADYVAAHNGFGFDFRLWRTRLIKNGFQPHHEPKELDTKRWAKGKFMFTTNSQDNVTRELGLTPKMETEKHLHEKCIDQGDPRAWRQMKKYNKQDVQGLRDMAKRMAPWITNTPNGNVLRDTIMQCPNPICPDPARMIFRGVRIKSNTAKVRRLQCQACGKWASGPNIQTGVQLR